MKKLLVIVLTVIVLLAYFLIHKKTAGVVAWDDACKKELVIHNKKIEVCISDTVDTRRKGLSDTPSLSQGKGMLFVFDEMGSHSFWMKDMNYPIDILWLDEQMNEVYRKSNASPTDFPDSYVSGVPAKYVLEVNPGEIPN